MRTKLLEQVYIDHHVRSNRYGFIYGGEARASMVSRLVGHGKRVLDLGCRDGSLTQFYLDGNEICGLDIDRRALLLCQQRIGIKVCWADLNDPLPFGDASFDCVVAGEVLEHLAFPAMLVEESKRVLVSNGEFIGSVPNTFRLRNRLLFLLGREFDDAMHLRKFSHNYLRDLLAGQFSQVDVYPVVGRVFPFFPRWLARWSVSILPSLLSLDWVFRARK